MCDIQCFVNRVTCGRIRGVTVWTRCLGASRDVQRTGHSSGRACCPVWVRLGNGTPGRKDMAQPPRTFPFCHHEGPWVGGSYADLGARAIRRKEILQRGKTQLKTVSPLVITPTSTAPPSGCTPSPNEDAVNSSEGATCLR